MYIEDSYKHTIKYLLKPKTASSKGDNIITLNVSSFTPNLYEMIDSFMKDTTKLYHGYLNSCAYYTKEDKPTFAIKAYPDVHWTSHLRYDYPDASFFKDLKVDLVKGIEKIRQIEQAIQKLISKVSFLSDDVVDYAKKLTESITALPESFEVGLHGLHDFTSPTTYLETIDYTKKHKHIAEIFIAELCLAVLLVELLIIWFTKGKGGFGRIRKFRKVIKAKKTLDDLGFEFSDPRIAYSTGMYFEELANNRISKVEVTHIIAKPLLGIEYHKTHNLAELAQKSDDKGLKKVIEDYGITATATLDFKGTINADFHVKYNSLTKSVSIKDNLNMHLSSDKGLFKGGMAIAAGAEIDAKGTVEKDITLIPYILSANIKIDASFKAQIGGFITFEQQYGYQNNQLYYQNKIFFSGIKGKAKQRVLGSVNDKPAWDSNPEDKYIYFTLFDDMSITLGKSFLFKE